MPRVVMRANLWIWGFVTVIGLMVAGLIIWLKGAEWFPGIPTIYMVIALLSFPPNLLQFYCRSILQGRQDFRRYNYLTVIVQLTTFVLSAFFILVLKQGVGWVLGAFLLGQVLSLAVHGDSAHPVPARGAQERGSRALVDVR